jgi:hypothetical protein
MALYEDMYTLVSWSSSTNSSKKVIRQRSRGLIFFSIDRSASSAFTGINSASSLKIPHLTPQHL